MALTSAEPEMTEQSEIRPIVGQKQNRSARKHPTSTALTNEGFKFKSFSW